MAAYLGIVVEQSLQNGHAIGQFKVLGTWKGQSWTMHLVSIPEELLDEQVSLLRANMVPDGTWYTHFFRDDKLVVVFRNAVFRVGTDPATWGPAVTHGLSIGIPKDQLDFRPRTEADAYAFFAIAPASPA